MSSNDYCPEHTECFRQLTENSTCIGGIKRKLTETDGHIIDLAKDIKSIEERKVSLKVFIWIMGFVFTAVGVVAGMGIESREDRAVTRSRLEDIQRHQAEMFTDLKDAIGELQK